MVISLPVVLCGDQPPSPVVNAGSPVHVSERRQVLFRVDLAVHDALVRCASGVTGPFPTDDRARPAEAERALSIVLVLQVQRQIT